MAKTTNSNYGGVWQFAGADSDAFDRMDIAGPAEDLDTHDHSSGKGLGVARVADGAALGSTFTGHDHSSGKGDPVALLSAAADLGAAPQLSGDKLRGTYASAFLRTRHIASIDDNGVDQLLWEGTNAPYGVAIVVASANASGAVFSVQGTIGATVLLAGDATQWSNTETTDTKTNVYWDAGNNRYEIENKLGAASTYEVLWFGN